MNDKEKILVVEDEITNVILIKRILTKAGYDVDVAYNGMEALGKIEKENYTAILTDWMMPQLDGIELIRRVREDKSVSPFIMMITALTSDGAREYSLDSGADDYIAKPINIKELLERLSDGLSRHKKQFEKPDFDSSPNITESEVKPDFPAVVIATSTGGPPTLIEILKNATNRKATYFVVQHGPPWMLETFTKRLNRNTELEVVLAENGKEFQTGIIYIVPGEVHIRILEGNKIELYKGQKVNFVRPSADPLISSASEIFGKYLLALVLTGLGHDGAKSCREVVARGGKVLIQDPKTCIAPSMPQAIINMGVEHTMLPKDKILSKMESIVNKLYSDLKSGK
jgi:two-component system, chemotaxis family, protein-glutamate methylesterase/glutaminase